jgi:hypothetical protein
MDGYTDADIARIIDWRKQHHMVSEREKWRGDIEYTRPEPKNVHFFNYDPKLGPTDLSHVTVKRDESSDIAIFSIPQSFTDESRSCFHSSDDRTKGLDIQTYMTPHNAPLFPQKK